MRCEAGTKEQDPAGGYGKIEYLLKQGTLQ
jgi:hypothetical protein